jgi:hypothetical protein
MRRVRNVRATITGVLVLALLTACSSSNPATQACTLYADWAAERDEIVQSTGTGVGEIYEKAGPVFEQARDAAPATLEPVFERLVNAHRTAAAVYAKGPLPKNDPWKSPIYNDWVVGFSEEADARGAVRLECSKMGIEAVDAGNAI